MLTADIRNFIHREESTYLGAHRCGAITNRTLCVVRIHSNTNFGLIVHRLGYYTVTVVRGVRLPLGPPNTERYYEVILQSISLAC